MDSSWRGTVSAALPSQATVGVPTPRDPFSGPLDNIEPWNFKVLATLMFLVTFLSLSENFTVMLVTYRFKQLRQPLNYIIVNLSLADFLMSFIGGTISFLTNLYGYFFLGAWACVLEAFAVTYLGEYRWEFSVAALLGTTITRVSFKKLYSNPLILYSNERAVGSLSTAVAAFMVNPIRIVALWSLAVLAFERYFVICRPLGNIHLQGKHAALGLLFIWVFSFIWTIPPILGWSSYTVSPIGTTCEPNWYSTEYNDHTYIIAFFITCFIMPLTMIFISYGKLIKKLRKVATTQGRLGASRKPEKQATRMVVVMILAFLFCWTPYAAFSITVTACPTIKLDPRLAAIPAFFSKTANVYNPIIYVFMNKQFRKCLLRMFSLTDSMLGESNIHQTAERGAQIGNDREMPAIGTQSTASSNRAEDPEEHINCDSFAQLSIPENKVHPM